MANERILDIWAIQKFPNELFTALNNIKKDVIIFKNCLCKFKIGNKKIKTRQFDTVIYSEESDTMIMLMRGGKATSEMAEKYLDEHNIMYHIVNFIELPEFKDDENLKEFWFAREKNVLEDAVDDSLKRNNSSCYYDPNTKSKLIFKYSLKNDDDVIMFTISFKGIIEFEDKFILPTLSNNQHNLHKDDILELLNDKNISITTFNANSDLII